jgi:hypothetical protein
MQEMRDVAAKRFDELLRAFEPVTRKVDDYVGTRSCEPLTERASGFFTRAIKMQKFDTFPNPMFQVGAAIPAADDRDVMAKFYQPRH